MNIFKIGIYCGFYVSHEDLCFLRWGQVEQLIKNGTLHPIDLRSDETDYIFGDLIGGCTNCEILKTDHVNDWISAGRKMFLIDHYNILFDKQEKEIHFFVGPSHSSPRFHN